MTYTAFKPPRSVRQYLGQPGNEPSAQALPWSVLDSHANSVTKGLPEEYVVIGEDVRDDGKRFLRFGATREYIEATTDFRQDDAGRLRLRCPVCELWDGKHTKGCTA
jgi:hypothetical protein